MICTICESEFEESDWPNAVGEIGMLPVSFCSTCLDGVRHFAILTLEEPATYGWMPVVHSADCDEDGDCPRCKEDYSECPCPGPAQDGMEYHLFARTTPCEVAPRDPDLGISK
jgi:hypothetical protein